MPHIGQYNRLVTITAAPTAQDEDGQPSGAWTTVRTCWAWVQFLSGSATIRAGAEASNAKASIRLRSYVTDVLPGMRATLGSTVFNIKAVLPDEVGRQYVDLVCEVVT